MSSPGGSGRRLVRWFSKSTTYDTEDRSWDAYVLAARLYFSLTVCDDDGRQEGLDHMSTATIEYPSELTAALGKRPIEALQEVKLMAALKLFDSGRISSGLAARLADLSRVQFLLLCGQYGVSVFQQTAEELDSDTEAAVHASRG